MKRLFHSFIKRLFLKKYERVIRELSNNGNKILVLKTLDEVKEWEKPHLFYINEQERKAINYYSGYYYLTIKDHLDSIIFDKTAEEIISDLDKLTSKNEIKEDIILIRWTHYVPKGIKTIEYNSYVSTSIYLKYIHKDEILIPYTNHLRKTLIIIQATKGTKGLYIGKLFDRDEHEFLLPRETKLIIQKVIYDNRYSSIILCTLN